MYKYTTGIIIEKLHLPKGNKLLIFCKNLGLNHFFYPYKIKNLDLDSLNLVFLHLKYTNESIYINQYKVINYFENIRKFLYKKIISQTVLEIIKKTLPENQKENKLFNLTLSFLNYLNKSTNRDSDLKNLEKFMKIFIQNIGFNIPTNLLEENNLLVQAIEYLENLTNTQIKSKELLRELLIFIENHS